MGARCNIGLEEGKEILGRTPDITDAMDERLAGLFPHYLFFKQEKEGRWLACSGCNRTWLEPWLAQLDTPDRQTALRGKHDELTRCPRCGRVVTLKNDGIARSGSKLWIQKPVLFLLADGTGGLYGRFCRATKSYRATRTPRIELNETARLYWKAGETPRIGMWRYGGYRYEHRMTEEPWIVNQRCNEPWAYEYGTYYNRCVEDYSVIGWEELDKTGIRYNGYRALFGDGARPEAQRNCGICAWLGYYASGMAQLEFVAKLGLRGIARELIDSGKKNVKLLDWKQKRPDRFLRLRPETAKACLAAGLQGPEELAAAQGMERAGMRPDETAALMRFADGPTMETIIRLAGRCGCTVPRLCRWLTEQSGDWRGTEKERRNICAGAWMDYIREAETLGYDLRQQQVVMPKRLSDAHELSARTVKNLKDEEKDRCYRAQLLPRLRRRYEWDDGEHCIIVPSGMKAIIAEGQRLRHCVGGYAERHVTGVTVILFFRRCDAKAESLCTIELEKDGKTIRQIHGYRNEAGGMEPPGKTYEAVLTAWREWLDAGSPREKDGTPKQVKKKEAKSA